MEKLATLSFSHAGKSAWRRPLTPNGTSDDDLKIKKIIKLGPFGAHNFWRGIFQISAASVYILYIW